MKTQADKSSYFHRAGAARGVLTLLITGIAVILFSTAGIARIVGWGPNSTDGPGATGGVVAGNPGETRVESTRSYEITVRLADGSSRVIIDAKPASWRPGERVIVIDGADPSNR